MADMTFAEHVNIVANLDNSLSMSASLNRSGVALKVGNTYDVVSVLSVHNRTTKQTEHTTISGTIASDTIGAYLSLLESTIEAAYPIAVTTSTTSTVSQVATLNTIGAELALSGSGHYIRALNMKVSLSGVQQYDIDAELINPLELTPKMLDLTPEALLAIDAITENINAIDTVVSNIADVNAVADNIANLNTVASIQNLANMTTVANDLNAMDLNGIADVTVVANNLVLEANSSINRVSASIDNVNTVMSNITNIDTVAGIDDSVTAVALIDDSVVTVAGKIAAIETANANATNINTVSGSIINVNSVAATIVPNIAEILEADTNAATATAKAAEALSSANDAYASELLAEKWATEAVDAVVLSGKYSSYHWATKASENVASALTHAARTDNPHAVTAAQVGLGNVSNMAQVTSVTGTAPIVSSGGTTPAISISAATTSAPGSMSAADKTKLDGIAAGAQVNVATNLTVTAGTTAGPTINSSTGADVVIPSASATASGVVTTGAQTFAGVKTMTSPVLVTPSIGVATGTSFNSITGLASVAPAMDGVASVGTSTSVARQDHVHQSDTSKTNAVDLLMAIGNINSPLLDMPLKNSLAMKAGVGSVTFTNPSVRTYIDRYGVLKTASVDEPRFEKEGYLNEGASTNLLLQSEAFNTTWTTYVGTTTANTTDTTDPYGTNLAEKYVASGVGGRVAQNSQSFQSESYITVSVFAKKEATSNFIRFDINGSKGAWFNLSDGTISNITANTTASITALSNGWYRCSLTFLSTGITNALVAFYPTSTAGSSSVVGDSMYIFGAQLETLPFATSYIPTTSATVTRAADNLSVTGLNNTANTNLASPVMSIIYDMDILGIGLSASPVHLSQGVDTTNYWYTRNYTTNTSVGFTSEYTSLTGYGGVYGQSSTLTKRRIALSFNNSKYSLYENGIFVTEQTQATSQLTGDIKSQPLRIGNFLAAYYWHYGHISNVRIYDKPLTAQEVALA